MHESADELAELQRLLDRSAAAAGPHLRDIITDERRLSAEELCARLTGMRLLTLATVTADGRPLTSPVDGYFVHGSFWFSTGVDAVRARHLARRPFVSAAHVPSEELAVTVHGRARLFPLSSDEMGPLRQAMLDHYLPTGGSEFQEWIDGPGLVGARIEADRLFTYYHPPEADD